MVTPSHGLTDFSGGRKTVINIGKLEILANVDTVCKKRPDV